MNNTVENLKEDKIFYLIIAAIINIGILYLPNSVNEIAKHDGWISTILGVAYPLYIIFIANYLKKMYPNENILTLSKKYFGKYLGNILNMIFAVFYFVPIFSNCVAMLNFIDYHMLTYKINKAIILLFLSIGALIAHKGIKTISKLCEFSFFAALTLSIVIIGVLKYGDILNLMPIGDNGIKNIIEASSESAYAYSGVEITLIMYPMFSNRKKFFKSSVLSIIFSCITYTGVVLSTTYYLGNEMVQKVLWSSKLLAESIEFPIFNDLKFIVFVFAIFVTLRGVALYYYSCNLVLTDVFSPNKKREYYLIIYVAACVVSFLIKNEISRRFIVGNIVKYLVIYNLIYTMLILIMVFFKKGETNEK